MGWRDEWAGRGGVERAPWHTRKTETDRQTKIEIEGEKKVHFQDILGVQFSAEVIIQKIEHMSPFTTVQIPVSRCMYRFCWICTAYNSWGPKYLFQWIGILRKVKNRSRFGGLKHATWSKIKFLEQKSALEIEFSQRSKSSRTVQKYSSSPEHNGFLIRVFEHVFLRKRGPDYDIHVFLFLSKKDVVSALERANVSERQLVGCRWQRWLQTPGCRKKKIAAVWHTK